MSSNKNKDKNKLFGFLSAFLISTVFLSVGLLFITLLFPNNIVTYEEVIDKLTKMVPYLIALLVASVYFLILAFSKKYEVPKNDNDFPESNFYTSSLFELPNEDDVSYDYLEFDNEDISKEANYVEEFEPLKALNKKEILSKINHKYSKTYVDGDEKDCSTYYVKNNNIPNTTPEESTPKHEKVEDLHIENIKDKEVVNNRNNLKPKKDAKENKKATNKIVPKKGDWISLYYATKEDEEILKNKKASAVSIIDNVSEHYKYQYPEMFDESNFIYVEDDENITDNKNIIYEYDDSVLLDYKLPPIETIKEYNENAISDYKQPQENSKKENAFDNGVYSGFKFDPVKAPVITNKFAETKYVYPTRVVEEFPEISFTQVQNKDKEHSSNIYSKDIYSNFSLPTTTNNDVSSPVPFVYIKGIDVARTEEMYQFPTDEMISLGEFCYKLKPTIAGKKETNIKTTCTLSETIPVKVEEIKQVDNSIIVHEEKIVVPENNNKVISDIEEQKLNIEEYNPYYDDIKLLEEIISPIKNNDIEQHFIVETETANNAYKNFNTLTPNKVSPVPFVYIKGLDVPRTEEEYIYPTEDALLRGEYCYKFKPITKDYSKPVLDVAKESEPSSEPTYLGFNFDPVKAPTITNKFTETKQEYPKIVTEEFPEIANYFELLPSSSEPSPVPFVYIKDVDVPRTEEDYIYPTKEQLEKGEFCYKFKPVTKEETHITQDEPLYDDRVLSDYKKPDTYSQNEESIKPTVSKYKGFNFDPVKAPSITNKFTETKQEYPEIITEEFPEIANYFELLPSSDVTSPVPFEYIKGIDVPRPVEDYIYPTEDQLEKGEFCYAFKPVTEVYSEPEYNDMVFFDYEKPDTYSQNEESIKPAVSKYKGFTFDPVKAPVITDKYIEKKQEYPEIITEEFPEIANYFELLPSSSEPSPVPFVYIKGVDVPRTEEDYIYPTEDELLRGEFCYKLKPTDVSNITREIEERDDNDEIEPTASNYKGFTFDPVKAPVITNKFTETKQEYPEIVTEEFPEIANNFDILPSSDVISPVPFVYYRGVDVPRTEEEYISPTKEQIEKGEFVYAFKPVTKDYSEPVYATFTDILEVEMEEARKTPYSLSIGKMKSDKLQKYEKIEFDALAVIENKDTMKMIFPMLKKKEAETVVDNMVKKIGGDETISTKFSELGKRKITAEQFNKEIE